MRLIRRSLHLLGLLALFYAFTVNAKEYALLNVSYDVSRELYKDVNAAFTDRWLKQTGDRVTIQQSHDGSTKQAAAVIAGLEADVVTMNQQTDIDKIAAKGLISKDWRTRFPDNSAPYTSTTVSNLELFSINEIVPGGWPAAKRIHFGDDGIFDQIYKKE